MHEFSSVAKGNVSDADLTRAKLVAVRGLSTCQPPSLLYSPGTSSRLATSWLLSNPPPYLMTLQLRWDQPGTSLSRDDIQKYVCSISDPYQVSLKGEYTPLTSTNQQVDSITKDDVVQVRLVSCYIPPSLYLLCVPFSLLYSLPRMYLRLVQPLLPTATCHPHLVCSSCWRACLSDELWTLVHFMLTPAHPP